MIQKETTAPHVTAPRSVTQTLLLSCGILGSVLFTATYLIEGALHPGFDMTRQTITETGMGN